MEDAHPTRPLIMIVDDDDASRRALVALLRGESYLTISAEDCADALQLAVRGERKPDLVLFDVCMGMGAVEFGQARSTDPTVGDIPILVMTTEGESLEHWASLRASFIYKPFADVALLAAVARSLADEPGKPVTPGHADRHQHTARSVEVSRGRDR